MSDISASERRLSAALDRIDQLLETGLRRVGPPAGQGGLAVLQQQLEDAQAENGRLAGELAILRGDQGGGPDAAPDAMRSRLAADEQAARLAAANEELTAANRALIQASSGEGAVAEGDQLRALNAEIEALRAARAAEIAQMGDLMTELERLLGAEQGAAEQAATEQADSGQAEAPGTGELPPELAGDAAGLPDQEDAAADGLPAQERRDGGI